MYQEAKKKRVFKFLVTFNVFIVKIKVIVWFFCRFFVCLQPTTEEVIHGL